MQIRRAMVIANPASRSGRRLALIARSALEAHGVTCDLSLTERPGHAAELAAHHGQHYDVLFAVGGDGTAAEVAGALAGTDGVLGVLPGGTGNLLARSLGIPLALKRAVAELLEGHAIQIDLGRMGDGRRFAMAAGVGIDAAMVAETQSGLKQRLGVLAYVIMGARVAIRAVLRRQVFDVRLTVDGVVHERKAIAVMVANFGTVLGDRITLGPGIRVDDGLLDACVFAPDSIFDAMRIMWRMVSRNFRPDANVLYVRGRELRIETVPVMRMQADGEMIGSTPYDFTAEAGIVRVLVPRTSKLIPAAAG
jgi:diacylglycerol kinase (ATP)